jgi:hypothetical protein
MVRKKPAAFIDPKTGLLVRKTVIRIASRKQKGRSSVPSRIFKAMGDLFDLKFRKKP